MLERFLTQSFKRLFDKEVRRHVIHGVDFAEAEDVAAETFERLLSIDIQPGPLDHLVTKLGRFVSIDRFRRRQLEQGKLLQDISELEESERLLVNHDTIERHGWRPTERALDNLLLQERIEEAIAILPEAQQDVMQLVARGYEIPEIAQELGIPENVVRARKFKARKTLMERLKNY